MGFDMYGILLNHFLISTWGGGCQCLWINEILSVHRDIINSCTSYRYLVSKQIQNFEHVCGSYCCAYGLMTCEIHEVTSSAITIDNASVMLILQLYDLI